MARPDEIGFWDDHLAQAGSYVVGTRAQTVARLAGIAAEAHGFLSGGREADADVSTPRSAGGWTASARVTPARRNWQPLSCRPSLGRTGDRRRRYCGDLHRDDLLFSLDGRSAAAFASRAQDAPPPSRYAWRRLRFLLADTGDSACFFCGRRPLGNGIEGRRGSVLDAVSSFDQVWITLCGKGRTRDGGSSPGPASSPLRPVRC